MSDPIASPSAVAAGVFPDDYLVVFTPLAPDNLLPPEPFNRLRDVDDEGRPLLESYAPPDLLARVDTTLNRCPYRDSRYHHEKPMNVSALQQVRRHWSSMLNGFCELREVVRPEPSADPLSVDDLWHLTVLACLLPGYVTLGRPHPQPPPPAWSAAMVKTALGFAKTLTLMSVDAKLAMEPDRPAKAEEIFQLADSQGALIGPTQVCAGSQAMIVSLLDSIIQPRPDEPSALIETFVGDVGALQRFASSMLDASVAFYLFYLVPELATHDLRRTLAGTPALDSAAPLLDALEAVELDSDLFPVLDLLDDLSPEDRQALVSRIGGVGEFGDHVVAAAVGTMATEWLRPMTTRGSMHWPPW